MSQQIKKWISRIAISLVTILILALIVLARIVKPISTSRLQAQVGENGLESVIDTFWQETLFARTVLIHKKDSSHVERPLLIGIHGAPGDIGAFVSYSELESVVAQYDLLLYDRPGYSAPYNYINTVEQASFLEELVHSYQGSYDEIVFISHSFGGPIAALAAMNLSTGVINKHVMIAPVISPEEKVFWYSGIPLLPVFNSIFSKSWITSSEEKCDHPSQMISLALRWQESRVPTIHIHGTNDWLAPSRDYEFAESAFNPCCYQLILWKGADHFMVWSRKGEIEKYL